MAPDSRAPGAIGRIVELEITNVAHGGVFVARWEGRVVFVPDTAPGEVVRARITDERARFLRAEVAEVVEASPHRVPHVWDAASVEVPAEDRAGGAEFGHLALDYQRELKSQVLRDSLTRMAGIPSEAQVVAPDGERADGTRWRTRLRLHVDDRGRVGPFAARSHRVVPVSSVPLATAGAEEALRRAGGLALGEGELDIVAPSAGEVRLLPSARTPRTRRRPRAGHAARPARRPGTTQPPRPSVGAGQNGAVTERVAGREFRVEARGFWQVHRLAPETLTGAVRGILDEDLLDPRAANLDLYGGVGLLAAALGDALGPAARITTVEADELATDHAAANLAEWVGATALTSRVDRYLGELSRTASARERQRLAAATVILDPPRSGAGRPVVDALSGLRPTQILYVACDPVALARDAALLDAQGYALRELRAFDLFPHTHHLEAVALFSR